MSRRTATSLLRVPKAGQVISTALSSTHLVLQTSTHDIIIHDLSCTHATIFLPPIQQLSLSNHPRSTRSLCTHTNTIHAPGTTCIDIWNDILISGHESGLVKVWSLVHRIPVTILPQKHTHQVTSILFLPAGTAISGDRSGALHIWSHRSCVATLTGLTSKIVRICESRGLVFAAALGGDMGVWNSFNGALVAIVPVEGDLGALVDVLVDYRGGGRWLVGCVGVDGRIGVWDLVSREWLWMNGSRGCVFGTVGCIGRYLVCVDARGHVAMYDWERGFVGSGMNWGNQITMMVGVRDWVVFVGFGGDVEVRRALDNGEMSVLGCLAWRDQYDVERVVGGDGKYVVFVLQGNDGYIVEIWEVENMVRQSERNEVVLW